ncbi:hypothetical protein M0R04_09705 [Candidatus Dojkabacteria bacterium]|jgi:phosphotransferase system  glucose/maltose/N-acetylglucosamine-specific IIC component|nr:hypothetical protein [Candidatus Dojkabacteria bacterium]
MTGRCGSVFGFPEDIMYNLSCNEMEIVYLIAFIASVITFIFLYFFITRKKVKKEQKQ